MGKGRDDFFLIFLFTFFIKEKSKCLSGNRTLNNKGLIIILHEIVVNIGILESSKYLTGH